MLDSVLRPFPLCKQSSKSGKQSEAISGENWLVLIGSAQLGRVIRRRIGLVGLVRWTSSTISISTFHQKLCSPTEFAHNATCSTYMENFERFAHFRIVYDTAWKAVACVGPCRVGTCYRGFESV